MKIINMKWFASAAVLGAALLSGCDIPPQETVQRGYRGTGMEAVYSPEVLADIVAANQVPEAIPAVSSDGPKAGDIYQNVEVLGHLSVGEFTRLMAAITEWVSPEQGCNYCHVAGEGFEADTLYTKKVSRVMIAMTQNANENWGAHVGGAGVTCYTCHRGNNVPEYVWTILACRPAMPQAWCTRCRTSRIRSPMLMRRSPLTPSRVICSRTTQPGSRVIPRCPPGTSHRSRAPSTCIA